MNAPRFAGGERSASSSAATFIGHVIFDSGTIGSTPYGWSSMRRIGSRPRPLTKWVKNQRVLATCCVVNIGCSIVSSV